MSKKFKHRLGFRLVLWGCFYKLHGDGNVLVGRIDACRFD
jgi:hypothetical protein